MLFTCFKIACYQHSLYSPASESQSGSRGFWDRCAPYFLPSLPCFPLSFLLKPPQYMYRVYTVYLQSHTCHTHAVSKGAGFALGYMSAHMSHFRSVFLSVQCFDMLWCCPWPDYSCHFPSQLEAWRIVDKAKRGTDQTISESTSLSPIHVGTVGLYLARTSVCPTGCHYCCGS